jgi:hypothetical protein
MRLDLEELVKKVLGGNNKSPRQRDGLDRKKTTTTWNISTWAEKNGRDIEKVTLPEQTWVQQSPVKVTSAHDKGLSCGHTSEHQAPCCRA